jgi:hypothetical protein
MTEAIITVFSTGGNIKFKAISMLEFAQLLESIKGAKS